jgi:hypothetical protein
MRMLISFGQISRSSAVGDPEQHEPAMEAAANSKTEKRHGLFVAAEVLWMNTF